MFGCLIPAILQLPYKKSVPAVNQNLRAVPASIFLKLIVDELVCLSDNAPFA
jgi:hypothetical protein